MTDSDIVVVGGGVIGLTVALCLAETGREVTVVEPNEPGSGASFGNAGVIANYAVKPLAEPELLLQAPRLLFGESGPFAIQPGGLTALVPWLLRFAVACLPHYHRRHAAALSAIVVDATQRWQALDERLEGNHIRQEGCLYLLGKTAAVSRAGLNLDERRKLGVETVLLNSSELRQMEPGLEREYAGALYFPQAGAIADPGELTAALAKEAMLSGVNFIQARVEQIDSNTSGVSLYLDNEALLSCRHLILAAGAFSAKLARQTGDRIPLVAERGYHLEYDAEDLLSRPVCPVQHGFYLSPMQGRMRAAGTVELGDVTAPPTPGRLEYIQNAVQWHFPQLTKPSRSWMGFRPSLPDSLPVISRSKKDGRVIYAFGHGHLGMTLAPVTAELVKGLLLDLLPENALHAFRANRF